jgi:hypothetical protein
VWNGPQFDDILYFSSTPWFILLIPLVFCTFLSLNLFLPSGGRFSLDNRPYSTGNTYAELTVRVTLIPRLM